MSDTALVVQSHRGPYRVVFGDAARTAFSEVPSPETHVLIDARVAELHATNLAPLLGGRSVLRIEATEQHKSLERMPGYVEALLAACVRRNHSLLCVGGGIVQDIGCYLAATVLRGLQWRFIPTTLLAQADSCIGSKSSINVGSTKNIVGTYTPPEEVYLWPGFLETLKPRDIRSGIGEMLKVHAIAGPDAFADIARDHHALLSDRGMLLRYIRRSLEIKRTLIELDEFDRGPRNVLNYGHSFGHAIEAATGFAIPHGIAITIGMDLANFVAWRIDFATREPYERMHATLRNNYSDFANYAIDDGALLRALSKDKKNNGTALRLVLPNANSTVQIAAAPADDRLRRAVRDYLTTERGS